MFQLEGLGKAPTVSLIGRNMDLNEGEMTELPYTIEEGIQKLREIGMLRWIYLVGLVYSTCKVPEGTLCNMAAIGTLARPQLVSLK